MLASVDSGAERKVRVEPVHHSARTQKAKKTEHSSSATRQHKVNRASKPPQPPKRKVKVKNKEMPRDDQSMSSELQTAPEPEAAVVSSSTVVNVDTVRDKPQQEEENGELPAGLLESGCHEESVKPRHMGVCEFLLIVLVVSTIILFFPLLVWFCLKIIREHERAMVFRLGHLLQRKPRGPGLIFILPFLDICHKIDIRLKMLKGPIHTVVTKDLVSAELSASCYYRIENVSLCYASIAVVPSVLESLMQVSSKQILAHHTFKEILIDRENIAQKIKVSLDSAVCVWGIKVERVDIEDLYLPTELKEDFAIETEARRKAQLKVIAAEGERAACEALRASTEAFAGSPATLQLRLLQLLQGLQQAERPSLVLNMSSSLLQLTSELPSMPQAPPATTTTTTTTTTPRMEEGHLDGDHVVPKDSPMM
ncbi:podocin [Engraulis encrasicolus]|uniref:podocin n=1 Tax=Engraulis encrasicolus TaxID=184585 RepID=UPI002FD597FF